MEPLACDKSEISFIIQILYGGLIFFLLSSCFQKKKYVTALKQWMND